MDDEIAPTKIFIQRLHLIGMQVKWWYWVIDLFRFGRLYLLKKKKQHFMEMIRPKDTLNCRCSPVGNDKRD